MVVDMNAQLFKWFRNNPLSSGASIPRDVHGFRLNTVYNTLKAGLPMNKINSLREYLEDINKGAHKLTRSDHLSKTYIPILTSTEEEHMMSVFRTLVNPTASLDSDKYNFNPCVDLTA